MFFLTIEEKIDVETLVRKNPKSVFPETFSNVDAFCGVVALAVYEILLFLGIIAQEKGTNYANRKRFLSLKNNYISSRVDTIKQLISQIYWSLFCLIFISGAFFLTFFRFKILTLSSTTKTSFSNNFLSFKYVSQNNLWCDTYNSSGKNHSISYLKLHQILEIEFCQIL